MIRGLIGVMVVQAACAQTVTVPNHEFESALASPTDGTFVGQGQWLAAGTLTAGRWL